MAGLFSVTYQFLRPSKPRLVEKDVPDLTGKVTIVTGSNVGLGKEIAQILYAKNAKVYMLARSEAKARAAMDSIRAAAPASRGELVYLHLDLADLTTVAGTAAAFGAREARLDLLFNNAGVAFPAAGSRTAQGYELEIGVNCLGTFALTKLLTPALVAAAKSASAPAGSVRVVWVSSSAAESYSPRGFVGAVEGAAGMTAVGKYFSSKLGNYLHGAEFATRHRADGVVSVPLNPGALDSELWREQASVVKSIMRATLLYPSLYGAYTCLFAAFSPEITLEKSGSYVAPWGRLWEVHAGMERAGRSVAEGGDGTAKEFWEWSEAQVSKYI
ncbi:putative short-chain dehydrogenase [Rosellinia necatrix]|uniref:Putative short-chain dehydrogenase n=1 Tax=Rosellinia necatrix TaxID=77044 RepID=A0A1S8A5W1_ROSNE|nr:putative short-chain dehydrogenase [Rosellinia necatrix]